MFLLGAVGEGEFFKSLFEEKIKGIKYHHVRHQFDLDGEMVGLFRHHQASKKIAVGILLPIEEMIFGGNAQVIAHHRRAGMHGRAQTDDLGTQIDALIVTVRRAVMESDANGHGELAEFL